MIHLAVAAILAAAVTVAEGGLFFQPALSPDGKSVAFIAQEGEMVSICVAPADGTGTRTVVASVGKGARAHRLAARSLAQRPWSPDGKQLLYLAPETDAGEKDRTAKLMVVGADGKDARRIGLSGYVVENAAWVGAGKIAFTRREPQGKIDEHVLTYDRAKEEKAEDPYADSTAIEDGAIAADLVPSPDGTRIALLCLAGPRDERVRELRIFDYATGATTRLPTSAAANFMTWSLDGKKLFWVDTVAQAVLAWDVQGQKLDHARGAAVAEGLNAIVAVDGFLVGLDRQGNAVAVPMGKEGAKAHPVAASMAPVSAGGGKIAFVRKGAAGAAIIVADATKEALEKGDLGLPLPPPPAPAPEEPKAPETPRPDGDSGKPQAPAAHTPTEAPKG